MAEVAVVDPKASAEGVANGEEEKIKAQMREEEAGADGLCGFSDLLMALLGFGPQPTEEKGSEKEQPGEADALAVVPAGEPSAAQKEPAEEQGSVLDYLSFLFHHPPPPEDELTGPKKKEKRKRRDSTNVTSKTQQKAKQQAIAEHAGEGDKTAEQVAAELSEPPPTFKPALHTVPEWQRLLFGTSRGAPTAVEEAAEEEEEEPSSAEADKGSLSALAEEEEEEEEGPAEMPAITEEEEEGA